MGIEVRQYSALPGYFRCCIQAEEVTVRCEGSAGNEVIPILSLIVPLLAVFVGPLVSWAIAERQIETARRLANKQIVAPMRRARINVHRKKLAELSASTRHYFVAGFEDRIDAEYQRLTELEEEIVLMVNP